MASLGNLFKASLLNLALVLACQASDIVFTVSHFNDVSGQIDSYKPGTSNSSKAPEPCHTNQTSCIGGLLNVVHWLWDQKTADFDGIPPEYQHRFASGNLIGGESGWLPFIPLGWGEYAEEVSKHINSTATALGQKEFGAGVPRALTFANKIGTSVLSIANTCTSNVSYTGTEQEFCDSLKPAVKELILKADDGSEKKIGVIGFVSELAERLSLPGKLKFYNIPAAIKSVVNLKDYEKINTFIAIGDGNLDTAKEIIKQSPKVKLVVYGSAFSNTKDMSANYPEPYEKGFIATAGRYGSSVGKMKLSWNPDTGDIKVLKSKLVETSYPAEGYDDLKELQTTIAKWRGNIEDKTAVGHSRVDLEGGDKCWQGECNLGNLMADAVVHCILRNLGDEVFKYPLHAIYHGGAFFEETVKGGGPITKFDIHKWLPYHNNVHLVKVKGLDLLKVFNGSATGLNPNAAKVKQWRQFLQVSNGLEVYYSNKSKVPMVTNVRLVHDGFGVPRLGNLNKDENYYLAIPTYLFEGRGVYDFASGFWEDIPVGDKNHAGFDDDCLENYVAAMRQITIGFEERIFIDVEPGHNPAPDCPATKKHNKAVTVILTIIFTLMFLAVIYVGYFYVLPRLRRQPVEYPPNQL